MSITIRKGEPGDAPFVIASNCSLARETEGHELDPGKIEPGVHAALADEIKGRYSIAELDGRPVGCLMITREWSDWRNGWIWWIQSVYVDPEGRGAGVYRALHDDVVERAAAAGNVRAVRLYVDRDNSRARGVYERVGMTISRYDLMEQTIGDGAP